MEKEEAESRLVKRAKELERLKTKYLEKAEEKVKNFTREELVKKIAELEMSLDSMNDSWTGLGEWTYIGEHMYG